MGRPKGSKNKGSVANKPLYKKSAAPAARKQVRKSAAKVVGHESPVVTLAMNQLKQIDRITDVEKNLANLFGQLNKVVTDLNQVLTGLDNKIATALNSFNDDFGKLKATVERLEAVSNKPATTRAAKVAAEPINSVDSERTELAI